MSEYLFCSNCGEKLNQAEKYCHSCGSKVGSFENVQAPVAEQPTPEINQSIPKVNQQPKEFKKPKVAFWILMGFGILFFLEGILNFVFSELKIASVIELIQAMTICAFAALLYTKHIRRYGWGIAAVFMLCGIENSIFEVVVRGFPVMKTAMLPFVVLFVVFSVILIGVNIKKEK